MQQGPARAVGEGVLRVNERVVPIKAGQCFGKPRGFGCSSQILNTGPTRMVLLDVGTSNPAEVDLCHYPDHGELMARHGGNRWLVPTQAILPGAEMFPVYDHRYFRENAAAGQPGEPTPAKPERSGQ